MLGFAGFLRFQELANLKREDVAFNGAHVILHITSSKTDQLRDGASVLIARTANATCPVSMLQDYWDKTSSDVSENFLFRAVKPNGHEQKCAFVLL